MEFYTIGVYNSTEEQFFGKLIKHNIDTFCDIRRRRGVRGSQYVFVNSQRLQQKLHELNIGYRHVLDLAPTAELRERQKEIDLREGIEKRKRNTLGEEFATEYKHQLHLFDFDAFLEQLNKTGASRVVFFCVEEKPEACHRSIVANKLTEKYSFKIAHL